MYSFPPLAAAIGVLYSVVTNLTTLLTPVLGGPSAAAAIVLMTMVIRLLLLPVARAQVRAEHHRTKLAPEISTLSRKYQHNPERLRRELAALYSRAGTSPLAGCLPALVQAPAFMVLYGLFLTSEVSGQANVLLTHALAGVPLGAQLADVWGTAELLVFVVLLLLLAAVAWFTRRQAINVSTAAAATPMQARTTALLRLLPFGTVHIAAIVPLAAGLYLLTSTSWTVAERSILRRRLGRRDTPG
ncbi:YidC/Oxa1 family membrane protein insertase [Phytoactinopolyspora endophytica]|uniref:YidC/Oxa1 family membrane protein insertase n=1 Tax=Phytoactinopolyspora endophytica TaxID=1642495 RepID=UPI00101BF635|nr:membrane protein insertase YidC [Phytoactinopolyspora endophytica]